MYYVIRLNKNYNVNTFGSRNVYFSNSIWLGLTLSQMRIYLIFADILRFCVDNERLIELELTFTIYHFARQPRQPKRMAKSPLDILFAVCIIRSVVNKHEQDDF